ncbi:MAG: pgsA [Bacilli bacterium]|nr:pgsA [Bacilli bacterium]
MNLANRITVTRILLVPVITFFLLFRFGKTPLIGMENTHISLSELIATLIFTIAAVTDGVDGYIARSRKMITNFGKFLDPLADKLLVTAVLISLVEMHRLAAWVAILIISREFAVTGLRLVAAAEGLVLAASRLGKLKTTIQIIAIIALMLNNIPFEFFKIPFADMMIYLAVIITLFSGYDYFAKNKHVIYSGDM